MIIHGYADLGVTRQCQLLGISRASVYYHPRPETAENLEIMRLLDEQYLKTPFFGVPRMTVHLQKQGYSVNPKRVRRLLRLMGLMAIFQGPKTSKSHPEHVKYPYLLRDVKIERANQVWSTDITYIPMERGFMYLVAVMDWFSRKVLSWEVSNTLEAAFCVDALTDALERFGPPEIFNTDQGSQFTSEDFLQPLKDAGVQISMDGKGRCIDNIFVERLWRTVKYEYIYLHAFETGTALRKGLRQWFGWYNQERIHQSLEYMTPDYVFYKGADETLGIIV